MTAGRVALLNTSMMGRHLSETPIYFRHRPHIGSPPHISMSGSTIKIDGKEHAALEPLGMIMATDAEQAVKKDRVLLEARG
jgi:hypothetical protein